MDISIQHKDNSFLKLAQPGLSSSFALQITSVSARCGHPLRYAQYLCVLLCLWYALGSAYAFDLTMDLATNQIVKDSAFKGTNLKVSGVMPKPYELILKVTGPARHYRMWKKEAQYGLWVKGASLNVPEAQSYYYLISTAPLAKIADNYTLHMLGLNGADSLFKKHPNNIDKDTLLHFKSAFCVYNEQLGLFMSRSGHLDVVGGKIYRDSIPIPERAPAGVYTVDVYAFDNGVLAGHASKEFVIKKIGIYGRIDYLYSTYPLLYAQLCVLIALCAGFLAALLFWRSK